MSVITVLKTAVFFRNPLFSKYISNMQVIILNALNII